MRRARASSRGSVISRSCIVAGSTVPIWLVPNSMNHGWPRLGARQRDLAKLHRGGIDRADLVGAELHEPRMAARVELDAVGMRPGRRHLEELDPAGADRQLAD